MDMRVTLDGPVLFFGGPYSNLEATRAVLDEARRRSIAPDRVVCTGDVVAYGADAGATVDLVRRSGIRVVMGNCEERLAASAADCGCGFAPGSACDRLSSAWFAYADAALGRDERAWMAGLPRRIDVTFGASGPTLAVVHGSLRRINDFVFASTPEAPKALDLARSGVDGLVGGHCGLPFTQVVDGRLWHNPGVVGMPANDGTPRAWFSVLTPASPAGTLTVEHVPLGYDHRGAASKMRAAGLPAAYSDALSTGLWPNCDVLPAAEAGTRGVPIEAGGLVWRRGAPGEAGRGDPTWP